MIKTSEFVAFLESRNYRFFTGVPCSYFKDVINYVSAHSAAYYAAPNEGSALALASGAALAGRGTVVMIQNSGLGNLLNPLTSLSMIYKIPVLIFVSGRAYGIPDEPQHEIMGARMGALLQSLNVDYSELPQDDSYRDSIDRALELSKAKQLPYVFFVKQGTFEKYETTKKKSAAVYPLKRMDAITLISQLTTSEDLIFATTGMISRELFAVCDRPNHFYMQGSMGHIAALAMGTALADPSRRVVVLDGDGAFLMHMGIASMVGFYKPKNFVHIVLDNEAYETTGDQDTTSTTTDFATIAKACAYTEVRDVSTGDELKRTFQELNQFSGPVFLRVKINREETKNIPRITTKYSAAQITNQFAGNITSGEKELSGR